MALIFWFISLSSTCWIHNSLKWDSQFPRVCTHPPPLTPTDGHCSSWGGVSLAWDSGESVNWENERKKKSKGAGETHFSRSRASYFGVPFLISVPSQLSESLEQASVTSVSNQNFQIPPKALKFLLWSPKYRSFLYTKPKQKCWPCVSRDPE